MKNISYLVLIAIVFASFGCKKSEEIYSFYRPSNPQNFITDKGAELYAFAADDSVLVRADYYLKMMGQVSTYGSTIVHYGHCWHPSNPNPTIGVDTLMTYDPTDDVRRPKNDSLCFTSVLTRLQPNTRYFVRSYVITETDTGYNPVVTEVYTKDAIDEWFERLGDQRPGGARFDAVAFNLGDTIFFGTGDQGFGNLTKDINMYDPTTGTWAPFVSLISMKLPAGTQEYKDKVTDAVGFAIAFKDKIAGTNAPLTRCIYVGLGDYVGDGNRDDKSVRLLEYDLDDKTWRETSIYTGSIKSGCVSFVIDGLAYVGTGSNSATTNDWHVFDPSLDRDGNPLTFGWRSMGENVPGGPSSNGRVGAIAFTVNGRGYFGLGYDEAGNFLNDFWEFRPNKSNPVAGTWVKKADFPGAPRANASAFALGDQGYVGTGDNITGDMEGTYTGEIFEDFYRYDPFNNRWFKMRDYASNKTDKPIGKKVTRGVGFAVQGENVGFIGFGMVPNDPVSRAQEDLWMYRPFETGAK